MRSLPQSYAAQPANAWHSLARHARPCLRLHSPVQLHLSGLAACLRSWPQVLDRVLGKTGGHSWWLALLGRARAQQMHAAHRRGERVVRASNAPRIAWLARVAALHLVCVLPCLLSSAAHAFLLPRRGEPSLPWRVWFAELAYANSTCNSCAPAPTGPDAQGPQQLQPLRAHPRGPGQVRPRAPLVADECKTEPSMHVIHILWLAPCR